MISSGGVTAGTLPGTKTLPGRRGYLTDHGGTTGGRTVTTAWRSLKEARKKTTGSGITAKLLKKGTVSNKMVNGTTDKAGARSASIKSCKKKVSRSIGGKGMNWCTGAAKKFTRRLVNQIRTFSIPRVASEKREEAIRIKVQGERSAQGKGTKIKIQARFNDGANVRVKRANKLMIEVPIR
jgi:hypothetical protein